MLNCGNAADGSCASPYIITCGQNFQGNTMGGASNWSGYGNMNTSDYTLLTGPERIHTLTVSGNTTRTINLSGLTEDLDLVVATACSPTTVFAGAATISDPETVNITNATANPIVYYIIVDGYDGAVSGYTLSCQ